MENLNGPFNNIIPDFQKYKKSLGYKYDNISDFYRLDKKLKQKKCLNFEEIEKIYQILIVEEKNEKTKKRNYSCLKELYHFLEIQENKKFYLQPYYSKSKTHFKARILTSSELQKFFKILDEYCNTLEKEKSYVFPVLFRLVYSCGLRISEALNLKTIDFSRENRTIFIEKSKENVDRILPLSDSMYVVVEEYSKIFDLKKQKFFFEINGKKVSYKKSKHIFDKTLELLNFDFRIHDLRHTFTVTNFNKFFDLNYKEDWILYYLHIYLGHKRIHSTEYYLQMTPNRYKKIIKQLDKEFENLFPKVGDTNE